MSSKVVKINNAKLKVKLAVTGEQMAKGLMDVSEMPEDEGMLFCYPRRKNINVLDEIDSHPLIDCLY